MQQVNAAALVGIHAHALIASGMRRMAPNSAQSTGTVRWDRITPNSAQLREQALSIAREAFRVLKENGWTVESVEEWVGNKEAHGIYDLRAWHTEKGEAIIDLKTGHQLHGAWLQVGGYIRLLSDESGVRPAVNHGGILHIPRQPITKDPKGSLTMRSAGQLSDAYDRVQDRVLDVLKGERPIMTPGSHCRRCTLSTCPVREE